MKKYLIVFVLAVAMAAGITYLIPVVQKRIELARLARLTHIPNSEEHQHVSPEGKVVSHTHTYNSPELLPSLEVSDAENDISIDPDPKDYMKTNVFHIIWAALDMDEIRAEFQPYTLEEIHEKWSNWYSGRHHWSAIEMDKLRPREAWIARLYEYGYPFLHNEHYRSALNERYGIKDYIKRADTIPPNGRVGLPAEATWEEVEETYIKRQVISELASERAKPVDAHLYLGVGGVYTIEGVGKGALTPFNENTVYVRVSEDKSFSQFMGAKLTAQEEAALTIFGVAPKGMQVFYTDKKGFPLPADQKPRLYERAMAGLDAAESHVAKLIADHDALFQQGNGIEVPKTEGAAAAQMKKWFAELLLLHGGDLPKDVKALQEAITVLSAIRERGEAEPPKPQERSVPQPPSNR